MRANNRIAIFVPNLITGGAERSMLKLADGMLSCGYEVDLVLGQAEGPFLSEVPKGARVVDLKAARMLMSLPALVRYLRREQPAALLSVLHANILTILAGRIAGTSTRIVVSERNTLSSEVKHYKNDLRMRLMPTLVRIFYPMANCVVAVSGGVADDLVQNAGLPRERVRVIYNPIITPEFRRKTQEPLDHPWYRPGEPPVILAVGRLVAQKDFPTLIQAFAELRKKRQARLLILGEGSERPRLEAAIEQTGLQEDIGLPGFVINPYPYMTRSAAFVLSSRWEGLPGVLIEALYCGVPLIATDCPSGPKEILGDGKYGKLVPVGDVSALAAAMEETLVGKAPYLPPESWNAYQMEVVVNQYIDALISGSSQDK